MNKIPALVNLFWSWYRNSEYLCMNQKHINMTRVSIPKESLFHNLAIQADYYDAYMGSFLSQKPVSLNDCVKGIFFTYPRWIDFLLNLRDILVKPFHLKTGEAEDLHAPDQIELKKGATLTAFTVLELTNWEIILEMTDRHLDAWVSVLLLQVHNRYEVTLTTKVRYHNALGRIYFFIIKPFHRVIVCAMLRHLIHGILNQK